MTKTSINTSRHELRKFGLTFAAVCTVIAGIMAYKQNPRWPIAGGGTLLFLAAGLLVPTALRWFYVAWMKFAFILGWINTRILLGVFFYIILTPGSLLLRLFGKDLLEEKLDRSAPSYWKKREPVPFDAARYERLF